MCSGGTTGLIADALKDCAGVCSGPSVEDCDGVCGGSAELQSDGSCLGISQVSSYLPDEFAISQNYPNPFNPVTTITFDVAELDGISLIVYDLMGKEVATLASASMPLEDIR